MPTSSRWFVATTPLQLKANAAERWRFFYAKGVMGVFKGSLPAPVQSIVLGIAKDWTCKDVYVGCSGNFTVERVLDKLGKFSIHGNDVTVFSSLIGRFLSGKKLDASFNFEQTEKYGWVEPYTRTDEDMVATILVLSRMSQYMGKPNAFYTRMLEAFKHQFPTMHSKTKEKISKLGLRLKSFYEGDVCEMMDEVPHEAGVICYPPFFSGDYEKMFKHIEDLILWQPPSYEPIDKDRILDMFRKMTQKEHWIFATNDRLEEFEEKLVGMAKTTNRGVSVYVYSDAPKTRICVPNQPIQTVKVPRLGPEEEIGDKMTLIKLTTGEFSALRSHYMNINIVPGSATMPVGVLVDGKLIGVYALSAAPTLSNWDTRLEGPHIYLLSDFPVAPVQYERLAKLVLYAASSKESKLLSEQISNKRIRGLVTTAFSKRPVSMKYRGLFKLLNRKENPVAEESDDPSKQYYSQGYTMNYGIEMGQWTLQEGLAIWKKKHGQKGTATQE